MKDGASRKGRNELEPSIRLFQIRGTETFNRKTVEVLASAVSLNPNDVFLLKTQGDHYLWYGKEGKTYEQLKKELRDANDIIRITADNRLETLSSSSRGPFYPLEVLLSSQDDLPGDVDPAKKENFLSDDDFMRVFGIPRKSLLPSLLGRNFT